MSALMPAQLLRVHEAIARSYRAADLAYDPECARVVPLMEMLSAWPLAVGELPHLTRRKAAEFLSRKSGEQISLELDADRELAGFLYAYPYFGEVWGCLLVEKDDRIERRRFSAAHELGHYLLHFVPRIKTQSERGEYLCLDESLLQTEETGVQLPHDSLVFSQPSGAHLATLQADTLEMETEANRFAAELLIPEGACRNLVAHYGERTTPRRLATEFMVSPAAMEYRLRSLGLLGYANT